MICKKCGAEIEENAKFCTNCGAAGNDMTAEKHDTKPIPSPMPASDDIKQDVPVTQPVQQQKRTFTVKPGKGGGWIIFAKVLLWLLFAGIILIGVSSGIMMIMTGLSNSGTVIMPEEYYYYYGAMRIEPVFAVISGIAVIVISIILAFIIVCSGFLTIDACLNLKNMNDNLSELIKINAETGNTSEKINAALLEMLKKK